MRPFSVGSGPRRFSLYVACEIGESFSLDESTDEIAVSIGETKFVASSKGGGLLIRCTDLASKEVGQGAFIHLQSLLARWSLARNIPLAIPTALSFPQRSQVSFMPDDYRCNEVGWPKKSITPLLFTNIGAWLYPEHDFVAIQEFLKVRPHHRRTTYTLLENINEYVPEVAATSILDEEVVRATIGYTHAVHENSHVWGFLQAVTILEMLARVEKTNSATRQAVASIVKYARDSYGGAVDVDFKRIEVCLLQANNISISAAVKNLVRNYCAPTIARRPLSDIFSSPEACDKLISSIYGLRSKYAHEGYVKFPNKFKHDFYSLKSIALQTIRHILSELLT